MSLCLIGMEVFDIYIISLIYQFSISRHPVSKWEMSLPSVFPKSSISCCLPSRKLWWSLNKFALAAHSFRWWLPCIQPVKSSSLIPWARCETMKFLTLKIRKSKGRGKYLKCPEIRQSSSPSSSLFPPSPLYEYEIKTFRAGKEKERVGSKQEN